MALDEYRAKRHFEVTPEPSGGTPSEGALSFVVQKHAATALHYDFRLELDGVMLSWAVPKGPSYDPAEKRLAMRVEDHPLDYADFEGTIPAGEYGAGTVIVWDRGTWEPLPPKEGGAADAHAGLAKGDFKFRLHGSKLDGNWVLVRLKPRGNEKRESWLLIKERDDRIRPGEGAAVLTERPESVLTGRTLEQVAAGEPSATAAPAATPTPAPEAPIPAHHDFSLATLVSVPPSGPGWISEAKYDGYRLALVVEDGAARAVTRSGADWSERFPRLVSAAAKLPAHSALLDGEAVVFDAAGLTDFGALQEALGSAPERIAYVAFDITHLNGRDLTGLPLTARKELLGALLADEPEGGVLRAADHVAGEPRDFWGVACPAGLEGMVAKRAASPYAGRRTRDWLKIRCRQEQEFVVGGFTEPAGSRAGFGALLLGVWEGGRLVYAGRVGTGFTERTLGEIRGRLDALAVADPPFDPPPSDIDRAVHWVRPELVAQVRFREWTAEGLLRQPSFAGLREDADPLAVTREQPGDTDTPAPDAVPAPTTPAVSVQITNPDKKLFPASDLTKADYAAYFAEIAPHALREIAERPVTLVRCPSAGETKCFYQRHPDAGLPAAVHALGHALAGHDTAEQWLWIDSADGLVSFAQMGAAEIHTWLSRVDAPRRPDRLVFDLDPGPDVAWEQVAATARMLGDELEGLGLEPFVKTTGGKGLHVVAAIEPVWEFDRVKALARALVEDAARRDPELLTAKMSKAERPGRIYLDYLRNGEGSSAVAAYSLRYRDGAPVATPVSWDELAAGVEPGAFGVTEVLHRVRSGVDPWVRLGERAAGVRVLKHAEEALEGRLPGV